MKPILEISHLEKRFGDHLVLKDINFQVDQGEVICVIGSSGSGKSTMLRCINFLEEPTGGRILYHGKDAATEWRRTEYNAKVGMVFQSFNLFSNMSVLENCVAGQMYVLKTPRKEAEEKAVYFLEKVGMGQYRYAKPAQLSGGQKQRVAIARALATNPKYILCDEATSALDPNTTRSILELLRQINQDLGVTIVVITHEMKVIDQICDRVAVIDHSHIAEEGLVSEVFTNPQSQIARDLIIPKERTVLETEGGKRLRLIFGGETTGGPHIAEMILACQAPVSILMANTKELDGVIYGYTIIELPTDPHQADKILVWLQNSGIKFEEVA